VAAVIFLSGIIAPASVRYAPLLEYLHGVNAIPKDLEVYTRDETPPRSESQRTWRSR